MKNDRVTPPRHVRADRAWIEEAGTTLRFGRPLLGDQSCLAHFEQVARPVADDNEIEIRAVSRLPARVAASDDNSTRALSRRLGDHAPRQIDSVGHVCTSCRDIVAWCQRRTALQKMRSATVCAPRTREPVETVTS